MLGERIVRTADEFGATWCIVRPTSIWGPWFDVPYKNFFTAIARNMYFHPSGVRTLKQWGFVLNSVYQGQKLLEAPQEVIQKKVFYLADFEPLELRKFADMVQQIFGSRPIRTMPINLLKLLARAGDLVKKLGWHNPPLTSFRLQNIVTDELCDTTGLQSIVGKLPYTVEQGIKITVDWMRNNR
jgi:nucleoside-diphosphate-sugar epimerase